MRLQGYPGAGELFVRLHDLDVDDDKYFAVLDGGRRLLLSKVLEKRSLYTWLSNLGEVGRRRPLWEGLLRVAEALSILHAEGTLHRALSPAAVFVGPEGQGDFRLSGFEWSLRVAGRDGATARVAQRGGPIAPELDKAEGEHSTATDWFDFGLLAANLFGIPVMPTAKRASVRTAIGERTNMREAERGLLLQLLEENAEERLASADGVTQAIRDVVRNLNVATAGSGRNLMLAVRLGPDQDLQRTVAQSSEKKAPSDNPALQQRWIAHDLRGDIRVISRLMPYPHFVLKVKSSNTG